MGANTRAAIRRTDTGHRLMADNTKQKPAAQAVLAYMAERVSTNGRTYFTGWTGHSKLLLFKTDLLDGYDNPVWRLLVQEAPVKAGTFHKAPNGEPPAQHPSKSGPGRESSGHGEDPNDDLPF